MSDFSANERVNAWIVYRHRTTPDGTFTYWEKGRRTAALHLKDCPDTRVQAADISEGTIGCGSHCEEAKLVATLTCPHGMTTSFEYGTFGDIGKMIGIIDAWAEPHRS